MRRTALLALIALFYAGCQSAPADGGELLGTEIFEDIPAPGTARVQTDKTRSFAYSSDSFRCAKYVYSFTGTVAEVEEFFSTTMTEPPYSWKLIEREDDLPRGHVRFHYAKGEDRCTVDARTDDDRRGDEDEILIIITVNYQ
ncbi:MAG: hypothetical protein AAGD14_07035 [Planctomycetota bacterium]